MTLETSLNLFALVISGAMAALLAAVLQWFAAPISHAHYRHWAAAWVSQAAYYLLGALSFGLGTLAPLGAGPRFLLSSATQIANVLGAALLVIGALGYVHRKTFSRAQLLKVVLACVLIGVTIAAVSQVSDWRSIRQIMRGAISAASLIAAGMIVRGANQSGADRPRRLLALSLIGFGLVHLHYVAYAVASTMGMRPPYSLADVIIFDVAWITAIVTTKITLAFADQQREAAEALEARDAEFRQLLEHSSDLVLILDESLVLRYMSPSTTRLLGWTPETLGQSFEARAHPADLTTLTDWLKRHSPAASSPFLLRLRHRSGNWLRVEAVATVAEIPSTRVPEEVGRPAPPAYMRVIINARDLTERERLEMSLRESQKLESIGRLAGGLAHDLNNIFAVISGNAELGVSEAPEPVRESLGNILHATNRAADLTRQLLTFARRQVVSPRRFDLRESIESTTRMAARLLPASVKLQVTPGAESLNIVADPGQIEQVLMNFIVNARDAIAGPGTITIETERREFAQAPTPETGPGSYVIVSVRDTGTGIPDHVRPHLFEPFFTTKGVGEGTGLGLATCYGIVRQAGGFIMVDSEVGVGSTFRVGLPAAGADDAAASAAATMQPTVTGTHVLVVLDAQSPRTELADMIGQLGYRVSTVPNRADAEALLAGSTPVDLIVCDMAMPRVGCTQFLHRLREAQRAIGVLILSDAPGDPVFLESLPTNAVFLQQPVQPGELARHLQQMLDRDLPGGS